MTDLWTVAWKELRWLVAWRGRFLKDILPLLLVVGVFGVLFPTHQGAGSLELPLAVVPWLWLPIMMTTGAVADSIAGERERHTLETLLATRLSDSAILLGKVLAGVIYGLGLAVATAAVGTVVANAIEASDRFFFYDPALLLELILASLLVALFMAGLAALVSTFLSNMRQTGQTVTGILITVVVALFFSFQVIPEAWQRALIETVGAVEPAQLGLSAALVLALFNAALLFLASARFKRHRLVLD